MFKEIYFHDCSIRYFCSASSFFLSQVKGLSFYEGSTVVEGESKNVAQLFIVLSDVPL